MSKQLLTTSLIVFLVLCIAVHSLQFLHFNLNSAIDFRNMYLGSKLWLKGLNPYDDGPLKSIWLEICDTYHISKKYPPGLPTNFLVYPPAALLLYLPFSLFSWPAAVFLNLSISILCLAFTIQLWIKLSPITLSWLQQVIIWLTVFAFKGTLHALYVGQPTFLLLFTGTLSIYLHQQNQKQFLQIFLLSLTAIKPTLAIPFILYFLHARNWGVLLTAGAINVALNTFAILHWSSAALLLQSFLSNLNLLKAHVYSSFFYTSTLTDITVLFDYIWNIEHKWYNLFMNLMMAAMAVFAWFEKKNWDVLTRMSCYSFLSLLLGYHLFYDVLLLIPFVLVIIQSSTRKNSLLIFSLPLFLPVNGILNRLSDNSPFEWLYLHLPVCIGLIFIGWLINGYFWVIKDE